MGPHERVHHTDRGLGAARKEAEIIRYKEDAAFPKEGFEELKDAFHFELTEQGQEVDICENGAIALRACRVRGSMDVLGSLESANLRFELGSYQLVCTWSSAPL